MARLPLIAIPIVALALASPAAAKEVAAAKVCGASDCREVKDPRLLAWLPSGGDPTDPPKHPSGGWYRVHIEIRGEGAFDRFTLAAVPGARFLRGYDDTQGRFNWMPMTAGAARVYRRVVRGLEPLPVSSLRGLDQKTPRPQVRVDEVVLPPAEPAPSGGFPWGWVGAGLGATALGGAGLATWRRRRNRGALGGAGAQAAG
jgi:hypothetical protein